MLRLNRDIPRDQRVNRVEEMLDFVSLRGSKLVRRWQLLRLQLNLRKAEKTVIGEPGRIKGLSGGEKRRLLFATEVSAVFIPDDECIRTCASV